VSYSVQFAPEVSEQLDRIHDYIARADSSFTASRYVDAIVDYCESLATFPQRGKGRNDLMPGLRITHYRKRTVIAFIISEDQVSIVGVFYGGQDYESILEDSGDV